MSATHCTCVTAVDVERLKIAFCERWLNGHPAGIIPGRSDAMRVLSCSICQTNELRESAAVSPLPGKSTKKNGLSTAVPARQNSNNNNNNNNKNDTISDVNNGTDEVGEGKKKKKKNPVMKMFKKLLKPDAPEKKGFDAVEESPYRQVEVQSAQVTSLDIEELFICVSCGSCFCPKHLSDHQYSFRSGYGGPRDTDSRPNAIATHSLFFGAPNIVYLRGSAAARTTMSTCFPTLLCLEEEQLPMLPTTRLPWYSLKSLRFTTTSGLSDWCYVQHCLQCECQFNLREVGNNNTKEQECTEEIGKTLNQLLYLRARAIAVETPKLPPLSDGTSSTGRHGNDYGSNRYMPLNGREMQRTAKASESDALNYTNVGAPLPPSSRFNKLTVSDPAPTYMRRRDVDDRMIQAGVDGIDNIGNSCYFNSVVQCVLRCRYITRPLDTISPQSIPGPLTAALRGLIQRTKQLTYEDLRSRTVSRSGLRLLKEVRRIQPNFANDEQQDAQELYLALVNGVTDEFTKREKETGESVRFKLSFEGATETRVTCSKCNSVFRRSESFMVLSVPVGNTLQDGLRHLLRSMKLTGKNQYACEECFKKLSPKQQRAHNEAVTIANAAKKKMKEAAKAAQERNAQARSNAASGSSTRPEASSLPLDGNGETLEPATNDVSLEEAAASGSTGSGESSREEMSLDCLYADADVCTEISKLGGTTVFHFMRFQFDGQEFRKDMHPVSVPLELDLRPFVSEAVIDEAERQRLAQEEKVNRRAEAAASAESGRSTARGTPSIFSSGLKLLGGSRNYQNTHGGRSLEQPSVPSIRASEETRRGSPSVFEEEEPLHDEFVVPQNGGSTSTSVGLRRIIRGPLMSSNPSITNATRNSTDSKEGRATHHQHHVDPNPRVSDSQELDVDDRDSGNGSNGRNSDGTSNMRTSDGRGDHRKVYVPPVLSLNRRLVGLVTHRGSLFGGHYVAYVRNIVHGSIRHVWFRCDDDYIDIVDESVVTRSSGDIYMAFYE